MAGYSYPGIMQLLTAAERPRGLRAIVPSSVVFDLYRDVAYLGGIANTAFGVLFTEQQKTPGQQETPRVVAEGDSECAANYARHEARGPVIAQQQAEAPYSDSEFGGKSYARAQPGDDRGADRRPRADLDLLAGRADRARASAGCSSPAGCCGRSTRDRTWALLSNGNHDFNESNPVYLDLMERFLAHFVGGDDNGFERTPKITQLHETSFADGRPSWTTGSDELPGAGSGDAAPRRRRAPRARRPGPQASVAFRAPLPSPSTNPLPYEDNGLDRLWQTPAPADGPRGVDVAAARRGPRGARLGDRSTSWLVAESDDADLQATITEVRPDGQEHYVQRGWLRASHRALDAGAVDATRPLHPSRAADVRKVVPGEPFEARLEVLPVRPHVPHGLGDPGRRRLARRHDRRLGLVVRHDAADHPDRAGLEARPRPRGRRGPREGARVRRPPLAALPRLDRAGPAGRADAAEDVGARRRSPARRAGAAAA